MTACCYTDANGTSCNCRMRADATQEVERNAAISTAIRALHTDATRAALDKVRAEGMREAVEIAHRMALTDANRNRTWRAGCEDVAEAIHRAADKLEGK